MFYMVIFAAAILWLTITIALFARLFDINNFFKAKFSKRISEGVSDLLQYASIIEDGIILLKNGSLLSTFTYKGEDLSLLSEDELITSTTRISKAISELGTGWSINFDAIRSETLVYPDRSASFFPNDISFAMDEERRRLFESRGVMFKATNMITLTYTPPLQAETKLIDMMYDDNNLIKQSVYQKNLNTFKQKIENFLSILSIIFTIERLGSNEYIFEDGTAHNFDTQLEFLHYCITGKSQPIALPKFPIAIDLLIGGEDLMTGITPKIGDKFISCIAIDGFPAESYPTILNKLSDLPIISRFSTRFICIDKYNAEKQLEKIQKKWQQKQRGLMSVVLSQPQSDANTNFDAIEMTNDAIEGITLQKSDNASFGYYTANIVLMDSDRVKLDEHSMELKKIISSLGFNARIETINCFEAYLGTLPGHNTENVRRFFLSSLNLGDLIPKHTVYTGKENAPCDKYSKDSPALIECVTAGNTPYHLNLHVDDVGHTLIVGPTGAGKSTLLAMIVAQAFRYDNASVFVFDKGMSMFALTKAVNGNHFELGSDINSGLNFAPFNYIDTMEDRQWLVGFIERLLSLNGIAINYAITSAISDALRSLYDQKIQFPNYKHSITDFISQLHYNNINLQEVLSLYDVNGAYGGYISAVKDNLELSTFCTFEIEKLLNLDDKIKLLIFDYLFRRIDLMLEGQPAFVAVDEAWVAFKNPVFAKQIIEWLKIFRKRNCSVILATQNINDMASAENLLTELIISTSSKIFLPNASALKSEFSKIYEKFGLNEQQIRIISKAIPKKHYYHYTNEGARLFELSLGVLALSFVAVSSQPEVKAIKSYIEKYNVDWYKHYLLDRNINIDDYLQLYERNN